MTLNLTQKERMLLQDQKSHEELCIKKYNDYANKTQDGQLKQLFSSFATKEQEHLNSINQMLSGQIPQMNQQQGQQNQQTQQTMTQSSGQNKSSMNKSDADLCHDMLMTEKYVSGAYDTAIFEMTNKNMRDTLNHIQKEEQQHGEGLFNYMNSHGMYNAQ